MPTLRALALLLVLLPAMSSCAAPLQNGGVDLRPGAEDRLDLLCRYREGVREAAHVCAAPEAPEAPED